MTDDRKTREQIEFMRSFSADDFVKVIRSPEAYAMRSKFRGKAERGEIKPTGCPHPNHAIQQFVDGDPHRKREGLPCNLFECTICHTPLWLVDPWGQEKPDG